MMSPEYVCTPSSSLQLKALPRPSDVVIVLASPGSNARTRQNIVGRATQQFGARLRFLLGVHGRSGIGMQFEEFAAARLPALLRLAAVLCGDRELARDLVQEVLTRALVRWGRIGGLDEPYAYVRTMLANEYVSLRRRRTVRTVPLTYEAMHGPKAPVHADPASGFGEGDALWQRLASLPRQQRAVIVLRYYEGLSDPEIADVLGCRPGSVRSNASRALATLRIELARPGALHSERNIP